LELSSLGHGNELTVFFLLENWGVVWS
jgi:hypothetical protein